MKILSTIAVLFFAFNSLGQTAYTQEQFTYAVDSDIQYGTATNYAGLTETLYLDLYKPTNDNNCNRPCIVLVHGGAWVQGSKTDAGIILLSEKLAARGWVVAAIDYRLGTHAPATYDSSDPSCDYQLKCWNTTDSAEVFRANYRGQQDAKGAIRFMKERHVIDSTDTANFFLIGESAGGFIAFAAAFLNDSSEKPIECGALANAPTPDPFLADCMPVGFSTARPDLGDFNGTVALNGYDASVQGLGTFISGTFNTDIFANTTDWPSIYMFHQGSDIVVAAGNQRLLSRANNCIALATSCPLFEEFPYAHGSFSVNNYLTSLGTSIDIQFDYLNNSNGSISTNLLDCGANGHSIDNINLRTQNLADHFAQRVLTNGNMPSSNCLTSLSENVQLTPQIFPNPSSGDVTIKLIPNVHSELSILTLEGKRIDSFKAETMQTIHLKTGVYLVYVRAENGQSWIEKVVIH